jgi:hypothetical protein
MRKVKKKPKSKAGAASLLTLEITQADLLLHRGERL